MAGPTSEADSENILRAITPTLDQIKRKGQAAKLKRLLLTLDIMIYINPHIYMCEYTFMHVS